MIPHILPVRIYWEDTDASGLVYHTSYIRFMERGRTELLRSLGLDQRPLLEGAAPLFFVVRGMELEFIRPAAMDDMLCVETRVTGLGGASISLDQRVLRSDETLVTANVRVVCVESGRAKRLPRDVREKFNKALSDRAAGTAPVTGS